MTPEDEQISKLREMEEMMETPGWRNTLAPSLATQIDNIEKEIL
jgi:hypothetical protein